MPAGRDRTSQDCLLPSRKRRSRLSALQRANGIHGQGNAHFDQYLGFKRAVQVTYLIDPLAERVRRLRRRVSNIISTSTRP
jgi:hypothetical protein